MGKQADRFHKNGSMGKYLHRRNKSGAGNVLFYFLKTFQKITMYSRASFSRTLKNPNNCFFFMNKAWIKMFRIRISNFKLSTSEL